MKPTIVLVEDNPQTVAAILLVLEESFSDVKVVNLGTVQEFERQLPNFRSTLPALFLVDLLLPWSSDSPLSDEESRPLFGGLYCIQQLQKSRTTQKVPVVLFSAASERLWKIKDLPENVFCVGKLRTEEIVDLATSLLLAKGIKMDVSAEYKRDIEEFKKHSRRFEDFARLVAFGLAAASFAAVLSLLGGKATDPALVVALYCFAAAIPINITVGLLLHPLFTYKKDYIDFATRAFSILGPLVAVAGVASIFWHFSWIIACFFFLSIGSTIIVIHFLEKLGLS